MSEDPNIIGIEPSHYSKAQRVLLGRFRGRPRIDALVEAITNGCQVLEGDLFDLTQSRVLDLASGDALKQWAALVGQPLGTLTDAELRQMVRARLVANVSRGTPDNLIEVYKAAAGPINDVRYRGTPPASFHIWVARSDFMRAPHRRAVSRLMQDIKPGGVDMMLFEAITGGAGFEDPWSGFGAGVMARTVYP